MKPSPEVTVVWAALNVAHRTIHRAMNAELKANGLPSLQWYDVLWELDRAEHGMRPFELEKCLIFDQYNISRLLRRMIEKNLVDETAFGDDGRGKVVRITAEGREMRLRMWEIYGPLIQKHVGKIAEAHDAKEVGSALNSLFDAELRRPRQ
jgi:DNA-binding MarR family transcriptional regulator